VDGVFANGRMPRINHRAINEQVDLVHNQLAHALPKAG
jgi:hypothetical protein